MCVFPKLCVQPERAGQFYPFAGTPPASWDFTRFNPAFFRHLEQRIGQLRDLGIEADLILFHPYDKGTGASTAWTPAADDRYLRYAVARLAAFRNVWWSLANEFDFMRGEAGRRLGPLLPDRAGGATRISHLRSIHNGTRLYNHTQPWVTHASIQKARRPDGRRALLRDAYRKPIVFDECKYEGDIPQRLGEPERPGDGPPLLAGAVAGTYVGHGETLPHPQRHPLVVQGRRAARPEPAAHRLPAQGRWKTPPYTEMDSDRGWTRTYGRRSQGARLPRLCDRSRRAGRAAA